MYFLCYRLGSLYKPLCYTSADLSTYFFVTDWGLFTNLFITHRGVYVHSSLLQIGVSSLTFLLCSWGVCVLVCCELVVGLQTSQLHI